MSNEELKLEAIKKAYGEYFEECNPDNEGWSLRHLQKIGVNVFGSEAEFNDFMVWRPISLKGIENNNGWVFLSDRFCFPKEKGHYWFYTKNGKMVETYFNPNSKEDGYRQHFLNLYTHYQPIIKPDLPLW